jgi:hypothetical protein
MARNNHYIPRFMTAPWEIGDRRLVCCDTEAGKITRPSSKKLFAIEGLNSDQAEAWYGAIESRVAPARERIASAAGAVGLVSVRSLVEEDVNTVISLLMLQLHRAGTMHIGAPFVMSFDEIATKDRDWVDRLAHQARARAAFFLVRTDLGVLFPEGGFFLVPIAGAPDSAYGFPLTPNLAFVSARRDLSDAQLTQLRATLVDERELSTLSVSLGRFGKKVVVPPDWTRHFTDAALVSEVRTFQRDAANCFRVAAASAAP